MQKPNTSEVSCPVPPEQNLQDRLTQTDKSKRYIPTCSNKEACKAGLTDTTEEQKRLTNIEQELEGIDKAHSEYVRALDIDTQVVDDRREKFISAYQKHSDFLAKNLKSFTANELQRVYLLLSTIHFYTSLDASLELLEQTISLKSQLGENVRPLRDKQYQNLVRSRLFKQAINYQKKYKLDKDVSALSGLLKIPQGKGSIALSPDSLMKKHEFTYPEGRFLLIVGSPHCQPSERMFKYLREHKKLTARLKAKSFVLVPQQVKLSSNNGKLLKSMIPLNSGFVYETSAWPEVTSWATPTFYLVENGQVIESLDGWSRTEGPARFEQFLTRNSF